MTLLDWRPVRPAALIAAAALSTCLSATAVLAEPQTEAAVAPTGAALTQAAGPSREMLDGIVRWLSAEFDLPENYSHPNIVFSSPLKLMAMRYRSFLPVQQSQMDGGGGAGVMREVVAIYDDRAKAIHLTAAWSGATASEQSVLVHEMVHHLQNLGKRTYECPAAREKLAYEAQDRWLTQHGKSLEAEFDIDMMTLLVSSSCMF